MPNTSLTWEVYKTKAAKLKSQGLNFPQIYNKLGNPIFDGQQWRLEMDKGNIKRKRQSARQANRTKYNNLRKLRDVTKTEAEGRSFRQTQREAAADSDNLIHQIAYEGKPSIAEHDVALQAGGSKEYHSKSDPDFKEFKDNVERYTYANKPHYVVDLDNITGGVRLVLKDYHNKFQPTSQQPGRTIEQYEDYKPIIDAMPIVTRDRQLEQTLKGTPQEQVSLPQTTATTPRQNLTPQTSAPQSKVTPPQAAPEPKVNMAPQVMSAEKNGENGHTNGTNGYINGGNNGDHSNGNKNGGNTFDPLMPLQTAVDLHKTINQTVPTLAVGAAGAVILTMKDLTLQGL